MSVFTSRNVSTVEIPHDRGQTVTFRQLAPRHLEAAAKEAQRRSLDDFRAMGGSAVLRELQGISADQAKAAVERDPLASYDRVSLIAQAVTSWSYDAPIDAETVADLDDDTQEFLARAILRLSKPSLFKSADQQEAEQKNG